METQNLTNRELKDLLVDCQSVEKVKIVHGHKIHIYKKRAVLDKSGKPIPLDEFMTQERVMRQDSYDMSRGPDASRRLAEAKHGYKIAMRNLLGVNWKALSRKYKIYNVPSTEAARQQILKNINYS